MRALLLIGMFLGLFAAIFCFVGMDCTYIGGQEKTKYKILLLGTVHHFAGGMKVIISKSFLKMFFMPIVMLYFFPQGMCCFAAYCLFAGRLGTVAFTRRTDGRLLRYSPLFLILDHI